MFKSIATIYLLMNIEQWKSFLETIPKTGVELAECIRQNIYMKNLLRELKKEKKEIKNELLAYNFTIPEGCHKGVPKYLDQFYNIIMKHNFKNLYYPHVSSATVRDEVKDICSKYDIKKPHIDNIVCYLQGLYLLRYIRPEIPRIVMRDFEIQKDDLIDQYEKLKNEIAYLEKQISRI